MTAFAALLPRRWRAAAATVLACVVLGAAAPSGVVSVAWAQNSELAAARKAYDAADYAEAIRILRPLVEGGNADAQYLMAQLYFFGLGVEKNDLQAAQLYAVPAGRGNAEAQYRLGYMYATGHGVAYDPGTAERWWLEAAKRNHRAAIVALSDFYHEGLYRAEDELKARIWLNRAAATGDTEAMYKLGRRLMTPDKVATDFRRAYAWLYVAAYRGHPAAKNFIEKNKRFFAPHEVRRGEAWGKAYIQRGIAIPAPAGEG